MPRCPAASPIQRCAPRWPRPGVRIVWTPPTSVAPRRHGRSYWAATRPVELTEPVTAHAGRLAGEHALRGADAVHLASLFAVGGAETVFAVWDQRLRAGARTAGVRLAPAE